MMSNIRSLALEKFENSLRPYLGEQDIHFYWKARVGLYALLKAMNVGPGDEIILPAYTCVVVPSAILYLGAVPVYVDINISTFNSNIAQIDNSINSNTKVVICQNTYGLSSNLEEIQSLATKHKLFTIEDCTHGFGGKYNGVMNGLTCDAAIFSSQWNKPFSTGIGGFTTSRHIEINKQLDYFSLELKRPKIMEVVQLKLLMLFRKYFMVNFTYWPLLKLYRLLSSKNIIIGSSSNNEMNYPIMPVDFFKGMSDIQAYAGIKALKHLDNDLKLRIKTSLSYTKLLVKMGKNHVNSELNDNHSFLKYPLLVNDRTHFIKKAEDAKVELGDWFTSPLHPVTNRLDKWRFYRERYPIATYCADHVVNLPTTPKRIERVLTFLMENIDLIQNEGGIKTEV